MVTAILTDFGKVVCDFNRDWVIAGFCSRLPGTPSEVIKEALSGEKGRTLLREFECGSITEDDYARRLLSLMGVKGMGREKFWRIHVNMFTPNWDVIRLWQELQRVHGVKLVAVTDTDPRRLEYMKTISMLKFDGVAASFMVGHQKPHESIFKLALEVAEVTPEQCIFVDDIEANVQAAEKLGINAITFSDAPHLMHRLCHFGLVL